MGLIPGSGRFPGEGNGNPLFLTTEWLNGSGMWQLSQCLTEYFHCSAVHCSLPPLIFACAQSLQLCLTLCNPARLLCPWDSPGKNTGVGCRSLLLGIFLTQGSNPCLLHRSVGRFFTAEPPGNPCFIVPSPQSLGNADLLAIYIFLFFPECHIIGTIQYVVLSDWLFST